MRVSLSFKMKEMVLFKELLVFAHILANSKTCFSRDMFVIEKNECIYN